MSEEKKHEGIPYYFIYDARDDSSRVLFNANQKLQKRGLKIGIFCVFMAGFTLSSFIDALIRGRWGFAFYHWLMVFALGWIAWRGREMTMSGLINTLPKRDLAREHEEKLRRVHRGEI